MSTQPQAPSPDPRIEVVAYNLFAEEVGFSRLDLMDFNSSPARRAHWEERAAEYLARYDALAAEARG